MSDTPQILLAHYLKVLKLPTFLREYDKVASAAEGVDHIRFLWRLAELELIDRDRRTAVKSIDSFDFLAIPSLNKMLVLELADSRRKPSSPNSRQSSVPFCPSGALSLRR
jgi:hypothetical protein